MALRTADRDVHIEAIPERDTVLGDGSGLVFVDIALVDPSGMVHPGRDCEVVVTVEGPGVLQGLGNAAPASEESFLTGRCSTFRGRALAVVRATAVGEITVTVESAGVGRASATVTAHADSSPSV